MAYDDQDIPGILVHYTRGDKQKSWGVIDVYHWDPRQGSSGVSFYYMECAEKLKTEDWQVANHGGYWQRFGTEAVDGHGSNPVIYKEKRKFIPPRKGPRNLVMTVYTLYPIGKGENKKAICTIQEEGS